MARQQDEVKGFTETTMVLSNVREAVQRREWIQVSHYVRGKTIVIMYVHVLYFIEIFV